MENRELQLTALKLVDSGILGPLIKRLQEDEMSKLFASNPDQQEVREVCYLRHTLLHELKQTVLNLAQEGKRL
jgi:hypothetical protein